MLYITEQPLPLVLHHVKTITGTIPTIEKVTEDRLRSNLLEGGELNETFTGMKEQLYVLEYEDTLPPRGELQQALYNTVYLIVQNIKQWYNWAEYKDGVKCITINPELYKKEVEAIRALFNEDAYDYFWSELCLKKFRCSPRKWHMELISLMSYKSIQSKEKGEISRISIEELFAKYETITPDLFNEYISNIGTKKGTQILSLMSSSDLWPLFIGGVVTNSRPPFLYKFLVEQSRGINIYLCINVLQEVVERDGIDIRMGCIILNEFLRGKGVMKNGRYLNLEIDSSSLNDLFSLLNK